MLFVPATQGIFEVEAILDSRRRKKRLEYLVSVLGFASGIVTPRAELFRAAYGRALDHIGPLIGPPWSGLLKCCSARVSGGGARVGKGPMPGKGLMPADSDSSAATAVLLLPGEVAGV